MQILLFTDDTLAAALFFTLGAILVCMCVCVRVCLRVCTRAREGP
jgi:hypothetical protein